MTSFPDAIVPGIPQPLPNDPLGKRLCSLFSYLWQPIAGVNAPDPRWQTIKKYALRPRVLWHLWRDTAQLVGVRFDNQTPYSMIDIDIESPYHPRQNPQTLALIRVALETIGIYRSLLVRSSESGGLHLYIPLPDAVPTFNLAAALKQCLGAQGLTLAPGQLETFPNCKSYALPGTFTEYNAHRLPLQPNSGSCLLDADCNPLTADLGHFFKQWDNAAAGQEMREVRVALAQAKLNRRGRRHRQSTVVETWRQDLRIEIEEGWTGHGQTNHLLKTIACYGVVFEGLSNDALIEFVHQTAIQAPGYLQWCRHQHEIQLRCAVWARSAAGYYWKLGSEPQRQGRYGSGSSTEGTNEPPINQMRSQDAQRRIGAAMDFLKQQGTLPQAVTARAKAIAQQGAISLKTLYRHLQLWHPGSQSSEEEQSCKTPQPEPNRAIETSEVAELARLLKPSNDGEFYTSGGDMKCGCLHSCSDCSTPESPPNQPLAIPASGDPLTTSQHSFFLPFNLILLGLICTQALLRGDRLWVLQRLICLWG